MCKTDPLCRLALSLILLLGFTGTLSAQIDGGNWEPIWSLPGSDGDQLGTSVASAGDVNNDGVTDLIVGAPNASPGGVDRAGSALVVSGADRSILVRYDGTTTIEKVGEAVAGAGDLDQDGFDDVIVGIPGADPGGLGNAGSAIVYSGQTGLALYQFDGEAANDNLGIAVAGAGDVNNDGVPDVIVGSLADPGGAVNAGSAFVYSGSDGSLIHRFNGQSPSAVLGLAVAGAGDVNQDGFDDVIVGAELADPGGRTDAGSAVVFSGIDGTLMHRFDGVTADDFLGSAVAGAGDLNSDGFPDLVVGAPNAGLNAAGAAYAYSGFDGSLLHAFPGSAIGLALGTAVAGVGDLDRDGVDDLAVGSLGDPGGLANAGLVYLYSGADYSQILRIKGTQAQARLGSSIASVGDVTGNEVPDLVLGAPGDDPGNPLDGGAAYLYEFNPILDQDTRNLSQSAGGTVTFFLDFPATEAFSRYGILFSIGTGPQQVGQLEIPLTPGRVFDLSANGQYPPFFNNFRGRLDANGNATATITAGPGQVRSALVGRSFWFAAVDGNLQLASIARPVRVRP